MRPWQLSHRCFAVVFRPDRKYTYRTYTYVAAVLEVPVRVRTVRYMLSLEKRVHVETGDPCREVIAQVSLQIASQLLVQSAS